MIKYNLSGTWKLIKYVYTNISGTWKTVGQIYTNVNGTWKPMWSYQWNIGNWGNCSVSCGGGTQSRTVTCERNDGQTVLDSLCTKYVGTKPTTSQECNTQSCADCKYDNHYTTGAAILPYFAYAVLYWYNSSGVGTSTQMFWNYTLVAAKEGIVNSVDYAGYRYSTGAFKEGGPSLTISYYEICREAI